LAKAWPSALRALVYEFDRKALAKLIEETPEVIDTFATALARLSWREANRASVDEEPPPAAIERLVNLHRGQIAANYGARALNGGLQAAAE
jgi:hypothetical protein